MRTVGSIRFTPINSVQRLLAAADTMIAQMLMLKRHVAGSDARKLLELVFASHVSAPHRFDKSRLILSRLNEIIKLGAGIGHRVTPCFRLLKECRLQLAHDLGQPCFKLIKRSLDFFAGIAAHNDAAIIFNVAWAYLKA